MSAPDSPDVTDRLNCPTAVRSSDGLEGSARNLHDIRMKVCMFGYQPTTAEVSLINDLLYELHCYREGGVTEEMLRRNDGYIKVGRGCIIALESEKPSND